MKIDKIEIERLIDFTKVYRNERERKIRRVRRNRDIIQERYDSLTDNAIHENGLMSPDEEIEILVKDKTVATEILRKLRKKLKEIDKV